MFLTFTFVFKKVESMLSDSFYQVWQVKRVLWENQKKLKRKKIATVKRIEFEDSMTNEKWTVEVMEGRVQKSENL